MLEKKNISTNTSGGLKKKKKGNEDQMHYCSCPVSEISLWLKGNALFLVGQELYQLSKEKADFSVVAGEEEESTAGSSGENEGNSRSSTPHKTTKTPPSKSPAKAKKPEGKTVLPRERSLGIYYLPSERCLQIPRQLLRASQG